MRSASVVGKNFVVSARNGQDFAKNATANPFELSWNVKKRRRLNSELVLEGLDKECQSSPNNSLKQPGPELWLSEM
jgi:hypothetical protein